VKTHYDLLTVAPDAPSDEIKRAFRREIARYHPDKVQHLGQEFQSLAAERAAELTEAYRVLMDASTRAAYDEQVRSGTAPQPQRPASGASPGAAARPAESEQAAPAPQPPPREAAPAEPGGDTRFKQERQSRDDFVRKAAVTRMREAISGALGRTEALAVAGFDVSCRYKAKRALFKKSEPNLRVLVRYVPSVDAAAIDETWPLATRAVARPDESVCVFLMGSGLASRTELASAITEQRRQTRGRAPLVFVPLDVRDWEALVPTAAPAAVKTIIERLRKPA
jgi:hypothetical protein